MSRFLLCSADSGLEQVLVKTLGEVPVFSEADPLRLGQWLANQAPQVIFVDFQYASEQGERWGQTLRLVREIRRLMPGVPLVALGAQDEPQCALAALRAGVQDFVDPFAEPADLIDVAERLAAARVATPDATHSVCLLGVRPGVGCSLLAAHLSQLLQREPSEARTVLCDLGWPMGDGLLHLRATRTELDFAHAVHNVERIDRTLARTAFATGAAGVALVPLPEDLDAMQTVSHAKALRLLDRLTEHFSTVLIDAGGFPHAEFAAQVAAHVEQSWLITDQSVGALMSLAQRLRECDAQGVSRARLQLVVNRYHPGSGMTAEQIAERFELPLLGVVPERRRALMSATSQGRLLTDGDEQDAYVRAVQALLQRAWPECEPVRARGGWLQRLLHAGRSKVRSSLS